MGNNFPFSRLSYMIIAIRRRSCTGIVFVRITRFTRYLETMKAPATTVNPDLRKPFSSDHRVFMTILTDTARRISFSRVFLKIRDHAMITFRLKALCVRNFVFVPEIIRRAPQRVAWPIHTVAGRVDASGIFAPTPAGIYSFRTFQRC